MVTNDKISDVLIKVGKNMKKYRKEKGYTQQELAYLSGKTERCTISNIEGFRVNGVNLNTLIKLSIVLGIEVTDLFI